MANRQVSKSAMTRLTISRNDRAAIADDSNK
jgi:hypothetical protein